MAYNSVSNPAAFQGAASPWALNFAAMAAEHIGDAGGFSASLGYDLNGDEPFVVVPRITRQRLDAVALYSATLGKAKMKEFAWWASCGSSDALKDKWREYGTAFVEFEIDPRSAQPLNVLDHDGKIRAISALGKFTLRNVPSLETFDEMLGTSFAAEHVNWLEELDAIASTSIEVVKSYELQAEGI